MKVWPAPHDAEHEVLLQNPHYIGHPQAPSLTRLQHAHAARAEQSAFCSVFEEQMGHNMARGVCCIGIVAVVLVLGWAAGAFN